MGASSPAHHARPSIDKTESRRKRETAMKQTMKQKVRRRRVGLEEASGSPVRSRDRQERLIGRAEKLIRSIDEQ